VNALRRQREVAGVVQASLGVALEHDRQQVVAICIVGGARDEARELALGGGALAERPVQAGDEPAEREVVRMAGQRDARVRQRRAQPRPAHAYSDQRPAGGALVEARALGARQVLLGTREVAGPGLRHAHGVELGARRRHDCVRAGVCAAGQEHEQQEPCHRLPPSWLLATSPSKRR
jgi:hypothetical protein